MRRTKHSPTRSMRWRPSLMRISVTSEQSLHRLRKALCPLPTLMAIKVAFSRTNAGPACWEGEVALTFPYLGATAFFINWKDSFPSEYVVTASPGTKRRPVLGCGGAGSCHIAVHSASSSQI